ncbi:MAG TPA: excinuclease ABC subunit UvrC [Desulfotignum sp.]|nr:excinuclease ABC subunit UvrC [Desulfotignum sp.]
MTEKEPAIPRKLTEKYLQAPHAPGVYLMKDARAKTIYVGKAKDLKKRLGSYFVRKDHVDGKTAALLSMVKDFDLIITASDHEAFILESNLIKEYRPRYNVILKDGKNYPLLRIDMNEPFPAIQRVRRIKNDHALYFGPYSSSQSVNQTLRQIQKIFRLRKCRTTQFKNRSRPCLNYQINACMGACCLQVDEAAYRQQVKDAVLFLKGRSNQVIRKLTAQMQAHADAMEFEKAAQKRDAIQAMTRVLEKQVVVSADLKDRDVLALAMKNGIAVVTMMLIRSGRLIDTVHYPVDPVFREADEILRAFVWQYYDHTRFLPDTVLLDSPIEDMALLASNLSEKKRKKVTVHVPVRGEKRRLAQMARVNAREELEKQALREEATQSALTLVQTLLRMDRPPERIECFDNSNLAGKDPVSSMAVFTSGHPDKSAYRRYVIQDMDQPDDYACMTQVLTRRFSKPEKEMPRPDLLVVDGGKGQLGMAMSVLRELGIQGEFAVAGLAKKDEAKGEDLDKIYVPGRANPVNTASAKKALFLLQQVRDEAHRFAVTFQRRRREKRSSQSFLDTVPGIGPKKKKQLLTRFKGLENLKNASVEEIASVPGITTALAGKVLEQMNADLP